MRILASISNNLPRRRTALISVALLVSLLLCQRMHLGQTKTEGDATGNKEAVLSGVRVNTVEGDAFYQRVEIKAGLTRGTELENGDTIKTTQAARVELILQPGTYLRMAESSDITLREKEFDKVKVQLTKGTISFEILGIDGDEDESPFYYTSDQVRQLITVLTPAGEIFITRSGIYRIDVVGNRSELAVRKGEAIMEGQRVKDKHTAVMAGESISQRDFDLKDEDPFDVWCRTRARKLVEANRLLKRIVPEIFDEKGAKDAVVDLPERKQEGGSPYVVSARLAAVNFVESGVEVNKSNVGWEQLTFESELTRGDQVRTNEMSRAEFLLLPDIYLRLDGRSEVLFEQLSDDAVTIKVLSGAAIIDAAHFERKNLPVITVNGRTSSFTVEERGNYRLDVRSNTDEITVRDGKIAMSGRYIGSCHKISGSQISGCEKKMRDNFDFWSEHRGEGVVGNGRTRAVYLSQLRYLRLSRSGFWYLVPGLGQYTFVPFSLTDFESPYGGTYSTVLSANPRRVFIPDPMKTNRRTPRGAPTPN